MARQPEHLAERQRMLGRYLAALRDVAGLYQAGIARVVPCHRTTVTHAEVGSQLPVSDFWETGTPDEAVALGDQALTSTRVVTSVVLRARDLDRALVSQYPKLACVREFHEQYRQVAQRSTAAKGES